MKLQELAVANPTKQADRVFESYFGDRVKFNTFTRAQAKNMLVRVRALVSEHRQSTAFHRSEQDPDYLKLIVMEQALSARLAEEDVAPAATPADAQRQQALMTAQQQQKKRQLQDEIRELQKQIADKQKAMNNPTMTTMESGRARRLREASEIQQAQVVLASQDMVDQVQKMSEQVSAMQFKDLPALVDQIKNEIGTDQATQFNADATAALTQLLQNLQASKTALEQALGVVTGQAPAVPGLDNTLAAPADQLPAVPGQEEISVDTTEIEPEPEPENKPAAGLGRERR